MYRFLVLQLPLVSVLQQESAAGFLLLRNAASSSSMDTVMTSGAGDSKSDE